MSDQTPTEPVDTGARAERLATWLEGLGLASHLDAAGLPHLERDGTGRARWTERATGEPLTAEALEALDDLLHHEGSDPTHAVPVALVQLARQARVHQALLDSAWHTYDSLATLRGATVEATRFWVHKASAAHRLLVVASEATTMVPAFQLTEHGEIRPDLAPLLTPLLAAGTDPWQAWSWLTGPVALLSGKVPHEAAADPDSAADAAWAAVRLAERIAVRR